METNDIGTEDLIEQAGYERCKIDIWGTTPEEGGGFLAWEKTLDDGVKTFLVPMRYGMRYTHGESSLENRPATEWGTGLWVDNREADTDFSVEAMFSGFTFIPVSHSIS